MCKSSNKKRSEICIHEQFVTQMVWCGGEIENGDFYKGKNAKVGLLLFIIVNCFAFMAIKAYLLHFSYKLLYFAEVTIYAKFNRLIYALLS